MLTNKIVKAAQIFGYSAEVFYIKIRQLCRYRKGKLLNGVRFSSDGINWQTQKENEKR